jgi:hypothetical protein
VSVEEGSLGGRGKGEEEGWGDASPMYIMYYGPLLVSVGRSSRIGSVSSQAIKTYPRSMQSTPPHKRTCLPFYHTNIYPATDNLPHILHPIHNPCTYMRPNTSNVLPTSHPTSTTRLKLPPAHLFQPTHLSPTPLISDTHSL